jgi:lysophospholipase L1-like esterase
MPATRRELLALASGTAIAAPSAARAAATAEGNPPAWAGTWAAVPTAVPPAALIDFDAAMRDPADPLRLRPAYDSGDHLHPNDTGMAAMAAAVPLRWFR